MSQKSKAIADEIIKTRNILEEKIAQFNTEVERETQLLNNTEKLIEDIANQHNFFIGAILGREDIFTILRLHIETCGEDIKIPAKVYFNDKEK